MLDDMSHTNGTPFVSGMKGNSTPIEVKKKKKIYFRGYFSKLRG